MGTFHIDSIARNMILAADLIRYNKQLLFFFKKMITDRYIKIIKIFECSKRLISIASNNASINGY
ncbi:hypothetical protein DSUL_20075 [Desulfovibrionales bacterium]